MEEITETSGLDPQKWAIELICSYKLSTHDLSRIMGMRKDNLKARILNPIGAYVRVGKTISPRRNIATVLEKRFDQDRYEKTKKDIERDRNKYYGHLCDNLLRFLSVRETPTSPLRHLSASLRD